MFEIMATNDTKQRQVRLSGEWMEIDPSTFDFEFDVEVEVGLGAGKAGEQIQALNGLMTIQGQMIEQGGMNYLVTPKNIYNAATRMAEAMGYPNPDLFFQDPDGAEPPPPAPDPDMEKLKVETMKAQSEAELGAGEMQLKTLKEKNIVDHRASELALKEKVDLARLASQERIARGAQSAQVQSAMASLEVRERNEAEKEAEKEEE